ncbi:MAG: hypothetical protein QNJ38_22210 [Prochloraceae cyanobacterium]|nr:hypothetical protein [Prochloraceae cyanobacterium]
MYLKKAPKPTSTPSRNTEKEALQTTSPTPDRQVNLKRNQLNSKSEDLERQIESIISHQPEIFPSRYFPIDREAKLIDRVEQIISDLNNDLRHERFADSAYWEDNLSLDEENFCYSPEYSAFLASYE